MTSVDVVPSAKHPAKFSAPILDAMGRMLAVEQRLVGRPLEVLDPFAGVGRIHQLARPGRILTTGVEIEAEWAACHEYTVCADFIAWAYEVGHYQRYDAVATSTTYGNRLSDHHNARDGSTRHSYTHDLGHDLHPNNSGRMPYGRKYWAFHRDAAAALYWVLRPGALLLWNVSDFYRGDTLIAGVEFHRGLLWGAGFEQPEGFRDRRIETSRLRGVGATTDVVDDDGTVVRKATSRRADNEVILRFRKPMEDA